VHALDAFQLSAFHDLVSLSGSLALGFAAIESLRTAQDLWTLSRVDENYQISQWGEDDEANSVSDIKRQSFVLAYKFFHMAQK
jgi:chaperone required for assembly of F1-ATPase